MSRRAKDQPPRVAGSPAGAVSNARSGGKTSPPGVSPPQRWLTFAVCLFLALAVWAVFGQTRHHEFVAYDDDNYVYDNQVIAQGISWNGIIWVFTHRHADNWHPLTSLSHMLDCQLYGLNPAGHHLTSVLLHVTTVLLLFLVLRKMTGAFWRAAFVAVVFAIHPLRVESVAWVAERKDVLSGLFFMLTLWAYVRYVQQQGTSSLSSRPPASVHLLPSILHPRPSLLITPCSFLLSPSYWLAVLLFAGGLMSKPMLVTLPFVLLLLDYWPMQRISGFGMRGSSSSIPSQKLQTRNFRLLLIEKLPFLLLTVASCVVTIMAQTNAIRTVQALTFPWRVGSALVAYAAYLGQMFYPVGLAVFYPHPRSLLPVWTVGLSVLVLLIISAGVLAGRRKHPYLPVGWLWYLGMLVPVIGLLQVGDQARADRYTYLPQIGLYIMVTWGVVELCGAWRHRRVVLGSVAVAILAGLMVTAHVQTGYWKDSVSLWTHTLACTSKNSLAHKGLGFVLEKQGNLPDAILHYEQALQISPEFADAHYNLGIALAAQGRLGEAIPHYERALLLNPDYANAHNNWGVALATQGKLTEAVQHYEQALLLNPDHAEAHINLADTLIRQGKLNEAIQHCERALRLNPHLAEAHINWGDALTRQGKLNEAIPHFQQALQRATAQNNSALADTIRTRLQSNPPSSPSP